VVLKNKKILLGVTGSIAACKSVDLARRLTEAGAEIRVIMTEASTKFISPLTFEIVSRGRVYTDTFREPMSHIALTSEAELMVIAPATANIIGKFANGIADDMLSTCLLAFRGKVVVAPAMNWRMYENPAFQRNLQDLLSRGVIKVGPVRGSLACGEDAIGRMADVQEIFEAVRSALSKKDLAGRKILVTAGPTREYLDPVRFISNRSSGKMGYAIAGAAIRRGAEVILISGPSPVRPPSGACLIQVETTIDMRDAVIRNMADCSAVIMAAAAADFTPPERSTTKIEKSDDGLTLRLIKAPDILSEIGAMKQRPILVGFAAETTDDPGRAREKLLKKGADIIVFNNVASADSGFDVDTNRVTMIERNGETSFPLMSKDEVADLLLDRVANLFP